MSSTPLSAADGQGDGEEVTTPAKVTTPRQKAAVAKKVKAEVETPDEKPEKRGSAKVSVSINWEAQLTIWSSGSQMEKRKSRSRTRMSSRKRKRSK